MPTLPDSPQLRFTINHRHLSLTVNGVRVDRSQMAARFLLALINASRFRKGSPAITLLEWAQIESQHGRSTLDSKTITRALDALECMGLGPVHELATPYARRTRGPWKLIDTASQWRIDINGEPLSEQALAGFFRATPAPANQLEAGVSLSQVAQHLLLADCAFDGGELVESVSRYQAARGDQPVFVRSLIGLREIKALRQLERRDDIETLIAQTRADLQHSSQPLREYLLMQLKVAELRIAYLLDREPEKTIREIESMAAEIVARSSPSIASELSTLLALAYRKAAARASGSERGRLLMLALHSSESAVLSSLVTRNAELQQNVYSNHALACSAFALNERSAPPVRLEAGIYAIHWVLLSQAVGARWRVGRDTLWDAILLLGIAADHGVELHHLLEHPLTRRAALALGPHADLSGFAREQLDELNRRQGKSPLAADMPVQTAFLLIEAAWRMLLRAERTPLNETLAALETALGYVQDDQRERHLWCLHIALKTLRASKQVLAVAQAAIEQGHWRIEVLKFIGEFASRRRSTSQGGQELCRRIQERFHPTQSTAGVEITPEPSPAS